MKIRQIAVQNVRIHDAMTLDIKPTTTLIQGPNGWGKTSLIEAIYIALRGKSFRGNDDSICKKDANYYRINVISDEASYKVLYERNKISQKKQFTINDKKYSRLPFYVKYPIVLFEPDILRIISGSPQRRRDFLDEVIQQYDPLYSRETSRYNRALSQRNKLLKNDFINEDELFSWNVILSKYGASIIEKRQKLVNIFNDEVSRYYQSIAGGNDDIQIAYSNEKKMDAQTLMRLYEETIDRDRITSTTSIGSHRHDFMVHFNGKAAADVCSRGEVRTIMLALKFIEAEYIFRRTEKKPIIILDDVFGELDESRQARLLTEFSDNQVIMTSV